MKNEMFDALQKRIDEGGFFGFCAQRVWCKFGMGEVSNLMINLDTKG